MRISELEFAEKLQNLARSGKLVVTIDRGPDTDDCFYQISTVTLSTFAFKDQKIIFWCEPEELWSDPPEEVAKAPVEPLDI